MGRAIARAIISSAMRPTTTLLLACSIGAMAVSALPQQEGAGQAGLLACGEALYYADRVSSISPSPATSLADRHRAVHMLRSRLPLPHPQWRADAPLRSRLLPSS